MIARILHDLLAAIALGLFVSAIGILAATAARACDGATLAAAGSGFVGAALFGAAAGAALVAVVLVGTVIAFGRRH